MQKDKDYADLKAKIAELERMAEKKNVEIETLKQQDISEIHNQLQPRITISILEKELEAAQKEIKELTSAISWVEKRNEKLENQSHDFGQLQAELSRVKEVAESVIVYLQQFDTQEWFDVFGEDKFRPYKILNELQSLMNKEK